MKKKILEGSYIKKNVYNFLKLEGLLKLKGPPFASYSPSLPLDLMRLQQTPSTIIQSPSLPTSTTKALPLSRLPSKEEPTVQWGGHGPSKFLKKFCVIFFFFFKFYM